jgi:hypothetical protein
MAAVIMAAVIMAADTVTVGIGTAVAGGEAMASARAGK